jgi:hypothetical protein
VKGIHQSNIALARASAMNPFEKVLPPRKLLDEHRYLPKDGVSSLLCDCFYSLTEPYPASGAPPAPQ